MRTTAGMLLVGVLAIAGVGCASGRGGLAKSETPKSKPATTATNDDTRVTYGNPWGKPSDPAKDNNAAKPDSTSRDLEAQLAEARARQATRKADISENLKLAAEAEQRGDLAAAKLSYQKVVDADPRNGEAHHRLAVIADQQQDPRTADTHYTHALAANRKDADLLSDIGYSHFLRGNLDESERYLREALEVNNFHRMAAAHLAQVYVRQGKYDPALAMFRQVSTENEAQRMIAQAFPNGRPGGGSATLPFANDRRATPGSNEFADVRNAALTSANPPQGMNAAAPASSLATLQQLSGDLMPSAPTGAATGQASPIVVAPSINPSNASTVPSATLSGGQPAAATSQSNGQPFWGGNWGSNTAPPVTAASSSVPPANMYDVSRVPSPTSPMPSFALPNSTWNGQPSAMPPNAVGAGTEFQPASFDNRNSANPNAWSANPPGAATSELSNPEAARWAAQMAMNSGPGAMFPVVSAGTAGAPIMQAGATNPQNEVRWAYGENSPNAGSQIQNAVNWSDRSSTASDVQQGAWGNNIAPQSPWNDWQSPAPSSKNWNTPAEFGAPAVNPQPSTNSPSANNNPPQWQNGTTAAPSASAPPATFGPPSSNAMPAPTTISNWPYAPSR